MLNIVILAAGLGKRMQSDLPKVLHPLAGRPMLSHVLESARQLHPNRIIVIVGQGAERVQATYADQSDLIFALQQPQLGTGHAVAQALPWLLEDKPEGPPGNKQREGIEAKHGEAIQHKPCVTSEAKRGELSAIPEAKREDLNDTSKDKPEVLSESNQDDLTLVLYGDVPLVQPETLRRLLAARTQGIAVLTEHLEDPAGYGHVLRDAQGHVCRIVEHRDASPEEQAIQEINTGILVAPTASLKNWLKRLKPHNAQNEYYLTDIISFAAEEKVSVGTTQPGAAWETLGVNSRLQQAELERVWQYQQACRLLDAGVSLADPARFDLRGTLVVGRDVFIDVGCLFEGKVELADGVHIGPYCILRDVQVGPGRVISAFSQITETVMDAEVLA